MLNLAAHMPRDMKVTKTFQKLLSVTPPMENCATSRNYLGKGWRLERFDGESFKVFYIDISFKAVLQPVRGVAIMIGRLGWLSTSGLDISG
jgi:hypothetical protein